LRIAATTDGSLTGFLRNFTVDNVVIFFKLKNAAATGTRPSVGPIE
jgi:hypothetical protein